MLGARSLSNEEIKTLINVLNVRDRCLFVLGIRTGFRINELLSLNVVDVFDGENVRGSVKVTKSNMKGKVKSRVVPIHDEAKALILEYMNRFPVRSLNFPLFRTNPVNRMKMCTFHKALKLACLSAGVNPSGVSSHSMRKCYAASMFEALDQNIFKIQKAMGHASPQSTCSYLEVDYEEINNAIKNAK